MNALLLLCSDSAAIDSPSNRLSIFHVLEDFNAAAFPVVVPRFSIVMMLSREQSEPQKAPLELQITIDGDSLIKGNADVDFMTHLRARVVTEIQGLVIPKPGLLEVKVCGNGAELGSWGIRVNNIGQGQLMTHQVPSVPAKAPKPSRKRAGKGTS